MTRQHSTTTFSKVATTIDQCPHLVVLFEVLMLFVLVLVLMPVLVLLVQSYL